MHSQETTGWAWSKPFGAPQVKTLVTGFPVVVAGPYDGTTDDMGRAVGYTVARRALDPTAGAYADDGLELSNCYEITGRTDLEVGAVCWCEPDQTESGFVLIPIVAAGDTPESAAESSGAWLAGLEDTDCLQVTVARAAGKCSSIDKTQSIHLTWDGGASRWEGDTDFVHDGGSGPVYFTDADPPALGIDGHSGRYLGTDAKGGLLFGFGKAPLCGGTASACDNSFVVRVRCASCTAMAGWDGPGWYCVRETGGSGLGHRVELLEGDQYRTDFVIVSGPYADEAEALLGCPAGGGGGGGALVPGGASCAASQLLPGYGAYTAAVNFPASAYFYLDVAAGIAVKVAFGDLTGADPNWQIVVSTRDTAGDCCTSTEFPARLIVGGAVPVHCTSGTSAGRVCILVQGAGTSGNPQNIPFTILPGAC